MPCHLLLWADASDQKLSKPSVRTRLRQHAKPSDHTHSAIHPRNQPRIRARLPEHPHTHARHASTEPRRQRTECCTSRKMDVASAPACLSSKRRPPGWAGSLAHAGAPREGRQHTAGGRGRVDSCGSGRSRRGSGRPRNASGRSRKDSERSRKGSGLLRKGSGRPRKGSGRSRKDSGRPRKGSERAVKGRGKAA